jgi:hypothetical protein
MKQLRKREEFLGALLGILLGTLGISRAKNCCFRAQKMRMLSLPMFTKQLLYH